MRHRSFQEVSTQRQIILPIKKKKKLRIKVTYSIIPPTMTRFFPACKFEGWWKDATEKVCSIIIVVVIIEFSPPPPPQVQYLGTYRSYYEENLDCTLIMQVSETSHNLNRNWEQKYVWIQSYIHVCAWTHPPGKPVCRNLFSRSRTVSNLSREKRKQDNKPKKGENKWSIQWKLLTVTTLGLNREL